MADLFLTAYNGSILGPIAKILGIVMDKIYLFFANVCHIESIALAIFVFTIFIYIVIFPTTYMQQKFSVLTRKMQPELNALNDKYKGKTDQASQLAKQEEMQSIYDKYGISPTGSCIYMFIQMPILFALYRVFYNIPAYIGSVKEVFTDLVTGIQGTEGYVDKMQAIYDNANLRAVIVDFSSQDTKALGDYIIDVLYKLSESGWEGVREAFPNLNGSIDSVIGRLSEINYVGVLNISDTPFNLIKYGWAMDSKNWALIICALLVPLVSYLSQVVSIKLMSSQQQMINDQQAQQMKMMNNMMPLMSLFICFTVPVGLGFYWIAGAVIRTIQQVFLNKHFDKIDLNEIIEANKEKAAKKAEKRGIRQAQIYNAATLNTKNNSLSSKASSVNDKSEMLNKAEALRSTANSSSLAAKANKVKEYNNRNNNN